MCCLLGLVDVKHSLTGNEKKRIVYALAVAGEARGTDATGIAYNSGGKLIIEKQPIPAHRMRIRIPQDAFVITGHTRMATHGNARRGRNNHPFLGQVPDMQFALSHNGVLSNDRNLRMTHKLPCTKIETDSYVAVQLIEAEKTLDVGSVRHMAELLKGTFNFTILDRNNRLYIVKGNNPLCIYYFKEKGFIAYASTKAILEEALEDAYVLKLSHEEIKIGDGEILIIDPDGSITRSYFKPPASCHIYSYPLYDTWIPKEEEPTGYRKFMMDYAQSIGVPRAELDYLHNMGFSDGDLELCIYDREYRVMCLFDSGYYDEMEDTFYADAYFEDFPRT